MCNTAPYPQSCLIAHRSAADLGKCPPVPIHTFLSNVVLEAPRVVNQGSCFHKPPALAVGLLTGQITSFYRVAVGIADNGSGASPFTASIKAMLRTIGHKKGRSVRSPLRTGAYAGNRTPNPSLKRRLLFLLSYTRIWSR